MNNVLTSQIIKEHLNVADNNINNYLSMIDRLYEDSQLENDDVVNSLKALSITIADDVYLDNFPKVRDWMITYIFILCRDITE